MAFANPGAHLVEAATIFTGLAFIAVADHPVDRLRRRSTWSGALRITALALAAFVALAVAGGVRLTATLTRYAGATFLAALAEEAVFRRYLPDRLTRMLRRGEMPPHVTSAASTLLPQISFALAHAENPTFATAGLRGLTMLFVAGVLYQGLARLEGLWASTAIHAAINLTISFGAG